MTIAVCLIALALPIASVLLAVHSVTRKASPQAADSPEATGAEALENLLKGIADEKLAPQNLETEVTTLELVASDMQEERRRVEELLKAVGGFAIPRGASESEIRLLVRIPEDRLAEFTARCFGERAQPPAGDLLEIVIKKRQER